MVRCHLLIQTINFALPYARFFCKSYVCSNEYEAPFSDNPETTITRYGRTNRDQREA